jgi:hypothetical protein
MKKNGWDWLTKRVEMGRTVTFTMTENGDLGVFFNEGTKSYASATDAESAIQIAMKKWEKGEMN